MSTPKLNLNKEIIALFSGQSNVVTVPKLYIQLTGSYNLALVLNQCVYWSNKSSLAEGWFYKKYQEWLEETHLSERTLRRCFEKLSTKGLLKTKTKMVKGLNTMHFQPDIDKIIELISYMLDTERPNRPTCPDGAEIEQKNCTKVAPTGHIGRTESAKVTGSSIYTDKNLQIKKLTTVNPTPSSSSFFSEKQQEELLSYKIKSDDRPDELFLAHCTHHAEIQGDNFSKYQKFKGLERLLIKHNEMNEPFQAKGFDKLSLVKQDEKSTFTLEDFKNWTSGQKGYDWVGPIYNKQRVQG